VKLVPCILVITMLGAVASKTAFAEDAASRSDRTQDSHASEQPRRDSAGGPKSDEDAALKQERGANERQKVNAGVGNGRNGRGIGSAITDGPHGGAKGANSSEPHAGDTDAIDTRMVVPSRRSGGSADRARLGNPKFRIGAPASINARRVVTRRTVAPMTRNAIGLTVSPRTGIQGQSNGSYGAAVRTPAGETSGAPASGLGRLSKTDSALGRPLITSPGARPAVTAAVVPRGAMIGAGKIRSSSTPAGLGGPAKSAAGISGTDFRPKH
jgi:hypothetical protein